jgi:hypothetical protein
MRMWKNVVEPERPHMAVGSNTAHALCVLDKRSYTGSLIHAQVHLPINAHALTQKYGIPLIHGNNGFVNAPQCYIIRTLLVLFDMHTCIKQGFM